MRNKLLIFIFILLSSLLYTTVINIPADQPTIQAGINASINGDIVLVQPGTYIENINYNGKLITIGSLFLTTQDTTHISTTIIDGNSSGSVVTFESGEDSTAVLSGFTITNGSHATGGGILCKNSSNPSLNNLSVKNNISTGHGGGIYCWNSNPILENITITDNSAVNYGGGLFCYWNSSLSIKNVTIIENSANYGGGVYCHTNSNPNLENITISGNTASTSGGGIFCDINSNPSLINSILWNDSPQEIHIASGSVTATYSDIEGSWAGTGNINSDPLFVDPANGDYHLQSTSPCINAGDPLSPLDPDGTIVEMGAYYYQYFGPIWHISTTGSDLTGNGSEQFPFATIQHGINVSSHTDTVLVQPGTYYENINFNGKSITVGSLFLTTQDHSYISTTIIDGNSSGSVVTFENYEDATAILFGFTITNGSAVYGGGIFCTNLADPSLQNLIISGNTALYGGGINCYYFSDPSISNVTITDNFANWEGGGIYFVDSHPSLEYVTIIGNSAPLGGGIYFSGAIPVTSLNNVTISGNTANDSGGGIFCYDSSPSLQNVTISGNTSNNTGGGIYCEVDSSPSLINSILWNNLPQEIYISEGSVSATYSDIQDGWGGTGNIDSDPLFVEPGSGDYHLQSGSPCIDAGDPASPLDLDGTIADMGAYYFHQHFGPVWHISTTGSDLTGNGSEQYPFATIQHGINVSSNADTVLVQPGTYIENINYNGKLITVASLYLTTADPAYISLTTIDGNSIDSVIIFNSGEGSTAVLKGFTITNGFSDNGGGIYCWNNSSPSLDNVTITGNTASDIGGGVYFTSNANPNLQNVIISGNSASFGGGIYCYSSSPNLQNVTISSNTASYDGGGVYFTSNSNPNLQNVTISGNSAVNYGGGLYCHDSFPILINSILWNNSPQEIYIEAGSSITATYSDIEGSWVGTGNIDSYPLFVNPGSENYHLQAGSPCIDAGDPTSPLDPDGTIADMGAYYYHQYIIANFLTDITNGFAPLTVNFTDISTSNSGVIDEWYWDFGDGNNSSLQNPSNEYQLPGIYTVSLTVTDVNDSTDTESKIDYITVYGNDPPAPPTNVQINISGDDAIITWDAVSTTIYGDPCNPDGYVVYYNEMPDDEHFWFLAFTTETTHTHEVVAQFSEQMFYNVVTYVDLGEDEINYLKELNNTSRKVSQLEVKRELSRKRK